MVEDIKHEDIIRSIDNKDVSLRKDWEHLFILKHKFQGSIRRYLLSMGDFKKAVEDNKIVSHIVMCQDEINKEGRLRLKLHTESMKELSVNNFDEFMRIFNRRMIANGFLDDLNCTLNELENEK